MKLPDIDLEELKRFREQNFKDRLAFIDTYAEWLKKTPNKDWSSAQRKLIDKRVKRRVKRAAER